VSFPLIKKPLPTRLREVVEKRILKMCLICSILGLVTVYFASGHIGAPRLKISELEEGMIGSMVEISGTVVDLYEHQRGHLFVKLKDDSNAAITVPLFFEIRSGVERIEILDLVDVKGEVSVYKGNLEIIPSSSRDVKVQRTDPIPISKLCENYYGGLVKVEGTVSWINRLSGGQIIFALSEGSSDVRVFLPKNVAGSAGWLKEGIRVRVGGWYEVYNDEPEIKVLDISCLSPAVDPNA